MTDRRAFLRLAAVTSSGITVIVAGCVGGDDDTDGDTDDDTEQDTDEAEDTGEDTDYESGSDDESDENGGEEGEDTEDSAEQEIDEGAAQSHLDEAIDILVATRDEIEKIRDDYPHMDPEVSPELEVRLDDLDGRVAALQERIDDVADSIEDARTALDDAGAVKPADITDAIADVRAVANFQERQIELSEITFEVATHHERANLYGQAHKVEERIQEYQSVLDRIDELRNRVEAVELAREDIDHDAVDEPALEYTDPDINTYLDLPRLPNIYKEQVMNLIEPYFRAFRDLSQAGLHFEAGDIPWGKGDVTAAQSEWEAGHELAESARDIFEDLIENHVAEDDFYHFKWEASVLWETMDMFLAAVDAALDGDDAQADDLYEDAWDHYIEAMEAGPD